MKKQPIQPFFTRNIINDCFNTTLICHYSYYSQVTPRQIGSLNNFYQNFKVSQLISMAVYLVDKLIYFKMNLMKIKHFKEQYFILINEYISSAYDFYLIKFSSIKCANLLYVAIEQSQLFFRIRCTNSQFFSLSIYCSVFLYENDFYS